MQPKVLRKKYKNPRLGLYNGNHQMVSVIKQAYNIEKKMCTNESWELSFKISSLQEYISQNSCQMLIKIIAGDEPDYFIIKDVTINTQNTTEFDVKCYREEESLKAIFCQVLNEVGKKPSELFDAIKVKCKTVNLNYFWLGTDADTSLTRSIVTSDENSVWDNLILLAEAFDGWLEFTIDKNTFNKYVFLRTIPTDKGLFIKNGFNYQPLDINFSTKNIITRMFGYGQKDTTTDEEINIMSVNPTGMAYVENYSYFENVLGMSKEDILKDPNCLQEATFRDSNIGDVNKLFKATQDELTKKSQPEITGNVTYKDINIYENGFVEGSMDINVGEKISIINTDIGYTFSTVVKTITKKYSTDIMSTPLEISNIIPYSDPIKDLINSGIIVSRVTSVDTTSGQPYVPVSSVRDNASGVSFTTLLADKVNTTDFSDLIKQYPTSVLEAVNNVANATNVNLSASNGLTVNKGKAQIFNSSSKKVFWVNESGQVSIADNMQIYNNGSLVADISYSNGVLNIENKSGDINLIGTNIKINGTNLTDVINGLIDSRTFIDAGTFT